MYADPEYADTWRYTDTSGNPARNRGGERYINSAEWEESVPPGYSFVQTKAEWIDPKTKLKEMYDDPEFADTWRYA